ncbi:Imm27 family immunity protein [Phaeovulum sp. W22_SRMD_FR3]|uniref:Imm27 family immunity protein n=1 Tax=Phaeovulum sp. W22_SRMD_FR3 TaxID=3240274 RepID=UPI003F9D364E
MTGVVRDAGDTPVVLRGKAAYEKVAQLRRTGHDASGWQSYYVDEVTGARWLLDYPESECHGGGSPRLRPFTEQVISDRSK